MIAVCILGIYFITFAKHHDEQGKLSFLLEQQNLSRDIDTTSRKSGGSCGGHQQIMKNETTHFGYETVAEQEKLVE